MTTPTDQTTAPPATATVPDDDQAATTAQTETAAAPAPAGQTATAEADKPTGPGWFTRTRQRIATAISNWWGFVAEPMSVGEAWRESGRIVAHRIPADSKLLAFLWAVDNHTGRPFLFVLLGSLPTWANGPLLWCAAKPARRLGLYVVVILLLLAVPRWVS